MSEYSTVLPCRPSDRPTDRPAGHDERRDRAVTAAVSLHGMDEGEEEEGGEKAGRRKEAREDADALALVASIARSLGPANHSQNIMKRRSVFERSYRERECRGSPLTPFRREQMITAKAYLNLDGAN